MRKITFDQSLVDNNIELSVRHLKQFFKFGHGASSLKTKAVHDVSFDIKKGECFGLVGESGCGKTTTGRSLIRLYQITSGSVYFEGYRVSAGKRWNEKEIKWSRIKGNKKIELLKEKEKDEILFSCISSEDAKKIKDLRAKIENLENEQILIKENYQEAALNLDDLDDYDQYKSLRESLKTNYKNSLKTNKKNLKKAKKELEKTREFILQGRNPLKRKDFISLRNDFAKNIAELNNIKRRLAIGNDGKVKAVFDSEFHNISNNLFSDGDARNVRNGLETELKHYQKLIDLKNDEKVIDLIVKYNGNVNNANFKKDSNAKYKLIKKHYASLIKEIKTNIKKTRKEQKENIKQINFDNKHVNKKLMSKMQMIFQDPVDSLDPRMTVEDIIQEGLHIQGQHNKFANSKKVADVLTKVGLIPEFASRYPHEFSGGQRQRIGIARALIMNPQFLICDEPISALDVSIRAQIINLLNDLKEEMGLTIMFIAHDLSVVKYFCDRIAVMYFGEMVELASSDELFRHPLHPYSKALLSAIPKPDPLTEKTRTRIVYNPAKDHDYSKEKPTLQEIVPGHFILANSQEMEKYRAEIKELDSKKK